MSGLKYNAEFLLKICQGHNAEPQGEILVLNDETSRSFAGWPQLVALINQTLAGDTPHLQHVLRTWGRASPVAPAHPTQTGAHAHQKGLLSFHLSIRFAETHTWQGHLEWLERRRGLYFRSFIELMALLDEAVSLSLPEQQVM